MNVGAQRQRGVSSLHSSCGKPVSTPIVLLEDRGLWRAPGREIFEGNPSGTKIGKEGAGPPTPTQSNKRPMHSEGEQRRGVCLLSSKPGPEIIQVPAREGPQGDNHFPKEAETPFLQKLAQVRSSS